MFGLSDSQAQDLNLIIAGIQAVGVIATIAFAIRQITRNSRILAHDSYERLSREYQSLLLQTLTHKHLDRVWEALTDEEQARLEKSFKENELWPVWYAMSPEQKDCYRYTRSAMEVFERAWQLRQMGHINEETWQKWSGWIRTWSKSTYFWFLLDELDEQFISDYVNWIREQKQSWA